MESTSIPFGLRKVSLKDLEPEMNNILIVGIIIGKQRPRKFADLKAKENNGYRVVWNFTLRDSVRDYINVAYWGNGDFVMVANDKFHTGDVVEITRPKVLIRRINDYGEQFRPMVTSPYSLTLNELSDIKMHDGNTSFYSPLLHLPTKPIMGFVPLRDIHNRGEAMKETFIDILGAVRTVGTIRNVTTKNGEENQLREVVIFDHTSSGLKVTIWDPDIISRAAIWKPRNTILFITDVRVDWSSFQRSYFTVATNRSIVTENPRNSPEVDSLMEYAKNAPLETSAILDHMVMTIPDPNSIQNVMSIGQVHDKVNSFIQNNRPGDQQFTALLFAVVTQLDLDGLSPTTSTKCSYCKSWLKNEKTRCESDDCPVGNGETMAKYDISFDLRVMLSDQTGTLTNCRLSGQTAETVLNCSVQQFLAMQDGLKCNLKWNYLMERCAVRVMILLINRKNPVISIISCTLADKIEVGKRLSVY